MTESELREQVVKYAHGRGWLVFSLPIAKTRRPVKDATGYPDLTMARDGRIVFIELKTDDGVMRPDQMTWLRNLGPYCYVLRPSDWAAGDVARLLA